MDSVEILNQGRRSYILKVESVLKGGEKHPNKLDVYINPGATVEVTASAWDNILSGYSEFRVIKKNTSKKGK